MSSFSNFLANLVGPSLEPPEISARRHKAASMMMIWVTVIFGVGMILLHALASEPRSWSGLRLTIGIGSTGVLIAGGALLTGTLLGFLFGIPRTLQSTSDRSDRLSYQVNTNLEQISDWLTKIIVGVTLVQLREIPALFMSVSDYVAPALGKGEGREALAGMIMVYFGIAGFFLGYLGTRMYITLAVAHADRSLILDTVARSVAEEGKAAPPKLPGAAPTVLGTPVGGPTTAASVALQRMVEEQRPSPETTSPAAARGIALSLAGVGKYHEALPFFERANVDPMTEPNVALQHAAALGETERYVDAVSILERMEKARQGLPTVYQWLGYYLLWVPDRQLDAVKYTQQYLKAIGHDDGGAIFNLACAYAALDKSAGGSSPYSHLAIAELKRAVRIDRFWAERAIELREIGDDFTTLPGGAFDEAVRRT